MLLTMNICYEYFIQNQLTFISPFVILDSLIVLEKLVKPPVRKAPTGAFRYFKRNADDKKVSSLLLPTTFLQYMGKTNSNIYHSLIMW